MSARVIFPRAVLMVVALSWLVPALATFGADTWPGETTTGINLRREPGLAGAVLTALTAGERLTVLDRRGEWLQVAVEGPNYGFRGWVYGSYVRRLEPPATPAAEVLPTAEAGAAAETPAAPASAPLGVERGLPVAAAPAPLVAAVSAPAPAMAPAPQAAAPAPTPAATPATIPSAQEMVREMARQTLPTSAPAPPAAAATAAAPTPLLVDDGSAIPPPVGPPPPPAPVAAPSVPGPLAYLELVLRLATTVLAGMALLIAQRAYLLARRAALAAEVAAGPRGASSGGGLAPGAVGLGRRLRA